MKKKIIGVTVGTPTSPRKIAKELNPVRSINGKTPDTNGNLEMESLQGKPGADGQTPYIKNGYWYIGDVNTNVKAQGVDGRDGKDGANGKTPVKGTDYFTAADKAEMVSSVIAALPVYDGEAVTV